MEISVETTVVVEDDEGQISTKLKKLKVFNLLMAGLHALSAFCIIFLSTDFSLPIRASFLQFDSLTQTLLPATTQLFEIKLYWLIASFLFLSALFHLLIGTVFNSAYDKQISSGINKFRWLEYSLSASTMMVAISLLVGIYDLGSLIMIFALVAVMNLMGLMMEIHNQTTAKTNWLSFNIGTLAGLIPWIVVAFYFYASEMYGTGDIPTFVYWIYVSIFLFFNCFAINMALQYNKIGKWSDYLYGERAYIILSLIAKSALAWQVFAGTLRP